MTSVFTREKTINSYIVAVQSLLALVVLVIYTKTQYVQNNHLSFSCIYTCLIMVAIVAALTFFSIKLTGSKEKKYYWIDSLIIFGDILLITYLMAHLDTINVAVLFLIPIMIGAIKFSLRTAVLLAVGVGLLNGFVGYYLVDKVPLGYYLESSFVLTGVLISVSWLVAKVIKVEHEISESLYEIQSNLLDNKVLLESIIENAPLGIIVVDREEKIVHMNQEAIEINGVPDIGIADLVGLPYEHYFNLRTEKLPYEQSFVYKAFHTQQSYYKQERIRNGKLMQITVKPIYDGNGKIQYVIVAFQDISQEELTREKIKQLDRLNLVGQMAASIAHEIKNPLTTIRGFLQLAEKNKSYLLEENLQLLIAEIDRSNAIISDFLSVTRKIDQCKGEGNLAVIVKEQSLLIGKYALFNGVHLELDLEDVPDLSLDHNEIKQLLLNLCHNAVEAMKEGGVLTVRVNNRGDLVFLEVEDTGVGIPEELIPILGTPFVTTKEAGTGLGFTVCQRVAESHQAIITVESQVGKGTKVTVAFPILES